MKSSILELTVTEDLLQRFVSKVTFSVGGCWLWSAASIPGRGGSRYGVIHHKNVLLLAHRVSYALFVGPIPSERTIDHLCHTTLCANPDHLSSSLPRTALQRFFEKVVFSSGGCWLWTGAKNKPLEQIDQAYGSFRVDGKTVLPHRWLYETCVGPIPDGLQLDHLCRTRLCTNFDHVEPVTHRENCLRGFGASGINARKTHCPQGHPYDATNTIRYKTRRICRTCYNRLQLRRYHSHKSLSNV